MVKIKKKKWSESGLLLNSLSLGSILGFLAIFISMVSNYTWLNRNAINITFVLVGVSFIIMSKVFKDRGRYLAKAFSDGVNSSNDISSIVFIILGVLSVGIGTMNMFNIITAISSGVIAVSSLIITIILIVIWVASLRLEFKN